MAGFNLTNPADELIARYRTAGVWSDATIIEQWQRVADLHPDNDAVVAPDGRRTYAELSIETDGIAVGLLELGLEPGERVIFQVSNTVTSVLAWYGALKAGLVPVCTLAAHRRHEIGEIGRRAGAVAHLVQEQPKFDVYAFAAAMAGEIPMMRILLTAGAGRDAVGTRIEDLARSGNGAQTKTQVASVQAGLDPDGVAVLQLSGGTTGSPKLIPRRHHEYWYNARRYADVLGWDEAARVAHVLPIVHNAGVVCALHGPHSVGATAVVMPPDPSVLLPALQSERVTDIIVGPLLGELTGRILKSGTHLKRVVVSGSKPTTGMFEAIEASGAWPGQLYGMAEGLFLVTPPTAPRAARRLSVGVPISEFDEIRLLAQGAETEVADGQLGEVCVRGPYTIGAYCDARPRTETGETEVHNRKAFTKDGFYRTGDLGMVRFEDGYRCYSIEGRIKDVIDRGGEKISVEELEALIGDHPGIAEVAVVAKPSSRLGEQACAFIVRAPDSTVDIAELSEYLAQRGVAKFKWPEHLVVVDSLPRTAVGKIDKNAMRRAASVD